LFVLCEVGTVFTLFSSIWIPRWPDKGD